MLTRTKRAETSRRRHGAGDHPQKRLGAAVRAGAGERVGPGQELANDHALYCCQCGFVFESPVSTSVTCPHCGGTQAW